MTSPRVCLVATVCLGIFAAGALGACKKSSPEPGPSAASGLDDCEIVRTDAPHAVARLSAKHSGDAVGVARIIERCVAPDGDECTRIAKIVKAIPEMSPMLKASGGEADIAAVCKDMPAELRRCMLPSEVLAHKDECQKQMAGLAAMTVKPVTPTRNGSAATRCASIAIEVLPEGLWLGTPPDGRCYAARKGSALDHAWLESELKKLAGSACQPGVELSGSEGAKYQDLVAVMDIAVKVGLVDVALVPAAALPVTFDGADATKAAATCPPIGPNAVAAGSGSAAPAAEAAGSGSAVAAAGAGSAAAPDGPTLTMSHAVGSNTPPLADAPVILVTRAKIIFQGKDLVAIADALHSTGRITELEAALPPATNPLIILQADEETDARLVLRIVDTANHAGYSNMLFAVKTK